MAEGRVNAFPWLNGEWGEKAGDRRLQTALWLDAVAVKMCLKADDDPQSGCQVLHVTCPPSLTTILWMEVAITKAKSRRPNLLGLSTCLSLKTSLSSLGGGWKWFLVALCWSRRVLVLPVLLDPLWVQQPFAWKGVSVTLAEGVKNQPFLHWFSLLGLHLCSLVEQRKPFYLNTCLDMGDIFCAYFNIGL